MLNHISFGVANIERSATFYDATFEPLGYVRVWEDLSPGDPDQAVGYGLPGGGDKFTIKLRGGEAHCPGAGFHLWWLGQWSTRSAKALRTQLLRRLHYRSRWTPS